MIMVFHLSVNLSWKMLGWYFNRDRAAFYYVLSKSLLTNYLTL